MRIWPETFSIIIVAYDHLPPPPRPQHYTTNQLIVSPWTVPRFLRHTPPLLHVLLIPPACSFPPHIRFTLSSPFLIHALPHLSQFRLHLIHTRPLLPIQYVFLLPCTRFPYHHTRLVPPIYTVRLRFQIGHMHGNSKRGDWVISTHMYTPKTKHNTHTHTHWTPSPHTIHNTYTHSTLTSTWQH